MNDLLHEAAATKDAKDAEEYRRYALALALEHNLVTSLTSLIVVPANDDDEEDGKDRAPTELHPIVEGLNRGSAGNGAGFFGQVSSNKVRPKIPALGSKCVLPNKFSVHTINLLLT